MTMMRCRTVLAAAAVSALWVASVTLGRAQGNEVNVQMHVFQDSRTVSVFSPTVDFTRDVTDRTSLRISYGLDAISAASNSCARCHHDGADSRRQEAGGSMTRKFDAVKFTVGGSYSQENFYRSTTLLTSLARNFRADNTTLAGGYTVSLNQPKLHPTVQRENQFSHNAYVSLTQVLSKLTIVQAGYEFARLLGYQDNPFLRADVGGTLMLGHVPDVRTRQTVTARLRQALPAETYLEADYRRYADDWQIHANAWSVGLSHHFSPALLAGAVYRRSAQTGAYFYEPEYSGTPQFFTADFRLEPFASDLYTGKIALSPRRGLFGLPPGTALTFQYDRYRSDNGFEAAIASAGLRVPVR